MADNMRMGNIDSEDDWSSVEDEEIVGATAEDPENGNRETEVCR